MQDKEVEDLISELKVLNLRRSAILARLEEAYSTPSVEDTVRAPIANGIVKGDRVRIINKVKRPAVWTSQLAWDKERERYATVTRVTPTQVFFTTDNGVETWRAPNNLRRLR
jgi:hypothetical protein